MGGTVQDRDTLQRKLGGDQPTCHFFNSFFINKLFKDARKYCYSAHLRRNLSECMMDSWQQLSCARMLLHGSFCFTRHVLG